MKRHLYLLTLGAASLVALTQAASAALFVSMQGDGAIVEINPTTGATIASSAGSPVAGVLHASGLEFGPIKSGVAGLWAAINPPSGQGNDRVVRILDDRATVQTVVDFGNLTTNPWDVAFDSTRMYVVTDTDVKVYAQGTSAPITSFAHGLTRAGGAGVGGAGVEGPPAKKPFGIAVNPTTGHVVVTGQDTDLDETPMIRIFDSAGVPQGTINGPPGGSVLGSASIAFTTNGHAGTGGTAFLYTVEVGANWNMQVYDSALNLIRSVNLPTVATWATPMDGDNIPGMDVDVATGEIYLMYIEGRTTGAGHFWTRLNQNETLSANFGFLSGLGYEPNDGGRDIEIGNFPEPASSAMIISAMAGLLLRRRTLKRS